MHLQFLIQQMMLFCMLIVYLNIRDVVSEQSSRSDETGTISASVLANVGNWYGPVYCDYDQWAIGFEFKSQTTPKSDLIDDTAANGVRLICSNNQRNTIEKIETDSPKEYGTWDEDIMCNNGFVAALKTRVESYNQDWTSLNCISTQCSVDDQILEPDNCLQNGDYGKFENCPDGSYVCGLQEQYEPDQHTDTHDAIGLSRVILFCCEQLTLPSTFEPSTSEPSTSDPTTHNPTTHNPTTHNPTTHNPTTHNPTTHNPTTHNPTTHNPTTREPTTHNPTTHNPTTSLISTTETLTTTSIERNCDCTGGMVELTVQYIGECDAHITMYYDIKILPNCVFNNVISGDFITCTAPVDHGKFENKLYFDIDCVDYRRRLKNKSSQEKKHSKKSKSKSESSSSDEEDKYCTATLDTSCDFNIIGKQSKWCDDLKVISYVSGDGSICDETVIYNDEHAVINDERT